MAWLLFSVTCALVAAVAVPLALGRRDAQRWGIRRSAHSVSPNPYRGDTVHREEARRAPGSVRLAAGLNAAWGLLTLMIFAPAGSLLLFIREPLFSLALIPLLVSGFILGFALLGVGARLHRRDAAGALRTARFSLLHHVAVAVFFASFGFLANDRDPSIGFVPAIPAALGVAFALALRDAARRVRVPESSD